MVDILDTAQKDTTSSITRSPGDTPTPAVPPPPPDPTPADPHADPASATPSIPSSQEPIPQVSQSLSPDSGSPFMTSPHSDSLIVPPSGATKDTSKSKGSKQSPPPEPVAPPGGNTKKKKSRTGVILAAILLLLITLPIAVFYISQRQQLAELRGRAANLYPCAGDQQRPGSGQQCCGGMSNIGNGVCGIPGKCANGASAPDGDVCECPNQTLPAACGSSGKSGGGQGSPCNTDSNCNPGYLCSGGSCTVNTNTSQCGRNLDPGAPVCCVSSTCGSGQQPVCEGRRQECTDGKTWCTLNANSSSCGGGGGGGGSTSTPTPVPTHSPTPTMTPIHTSTPTMTPIHTSTPTLTPSPIIAQCTNIQVVQNGTVLDANGLKTLKPGDAVVIKVAGGNATKAHIRVNGGAWSESTTVSSGAYVFNYTIPANIANFTIESEIFGTDGKWH